MKRILQMNALIVLLSGLLIGCKDGNGEVVMPTNLQVVYSQDPDNPRLLIAEATADNAEFFRFDFGDGTGVIKVNSGSATHLYAEEGTYEIRVQAHANESAFISNVQNVEIIFPDPTETGYESPLSYDGLALVWQDEFEGSSLSEDWTYQIGDGCPDLCGWGNNELEYYREENTRLENGYLYITARKESFGGKNYTSSRIITKDAVSFQYGRIDIRAILPRGQGIWPALWMLGDNIDEVGWPACGEIDIMEMIGGGGRENTVHGTVHWDNNGSYANYGGEKKLPVGTFGDAWHVFSITWDAERIIWLLDNEPFHEIDITPAGLSEFRNSFFFIFNVAVGGNWPGNPNATTTFPQEMIVDYIRVFQEP